MTAALDIAGRTIGAGRPVFVIAEIGINHGGDPALAADMVRAAADAGADAVKLQTVDPDEAYMRGTPSHAAFQGTALDLPALQRLGDLARERGVVLFSTPGDFGSLELMVRAEMPAVKISSGLLTNLPLIQRAGETGLPMILSTGMARLDEVDAAVATARAAGNRQLAILQCTSLYPAPSDALNLAAIATLAARFAVPVGYSDHHDGALACLTAVAAGATILEKHFTLDRAAGGADHAISLEPDGFRRLVDSVRAVERMMGTAEKRPAAAEEPLRAARHRYLVTRRPVAAGETLSDDNIALKRTPAGVGVLPAERYDHCVGKVAACAIGDDVALAPEMVAGLE